MTQTLTRTGRWTRLRASLLALAVFAGACDSADNLATTEPTTQLDGASLDSIAADSSDSLVTGGTLTSLDLAEIDASEAAFRGRHVPFGPYGLWASYTSWKKTPSNFTTSFTTTNPKGIIKHLQTARSKNHRIFVLLTPGHAAEYLSRGRFDLAKWKRKVSTFDRADIKAAVRAAVADGTLLSAGLLDDADVTSRWGGVITKPVLDQMARHIKGIFPTLPVSANVQYNWRSHERFKVVDAIYSQYRWWRSNGNIKAYRDGALAAARRDGVAIVFGLNILDGGIQNKKTRACPSGTTGGKGTYAPNCRMTATQVREWGKTLGTAGCALLMWRYDAAFMSKATNVQAFKDVASTLARTPGKSCRRSGG